MFYKLVSDGDLFTFAKRKDSVSPLCYSFMPTSTYPKEWKNRFIFISTAMLPESPPLRDPKAPIEDSVLVLSADEIVQWKRMYENPTRAFTFPEGVIAMGGLSPLYSVRPRAFFGKKDCRDIKSMVGDKVDLEMGRVLENKVPEKGSSVHVEDFVAVEKGEKTSSEEAGDSGGSLRVEGSSDDEDLESRLLHKRKAVQTSSPKVVPEPRNIRLRLQSASGQKPFPATKVASEVPPVGTKGSLSKHLRSSSLVSEPLLGSSKAPIVIPPTPASSWVKDKAPEISVACVNPDFDVSPLQATCTSKPSQPRDLPPRSPLAPLFAEGLPVPYVPKWKITTSTILGTPETAQDFLDHVVPPPHKFMNFALNPDLFDDQYSMSPCEGFFRGAGMLQRVNELRKVNKELRVELRTSKTVAAELWCQVTDVERKLLEEKNAGALLEQREQAWERERIAWAEEKQELVVELKHQKELDFVSGADLETMYNEWGMATDDNQRLAQERYWLITQGFGLFLSAVSQSEEFKGSLERIYRAYMDVGYQEGLKDGYTHSSQGLKRKETPLYNSKAKKQFSKLDKEFGEKTPTLLEKILERPLMSINELKALLSPAGPSSPKSLSGDAYS
ncbi:hypothetical protein HanPI659440_Chr04g0143391 [Helianthus annuus]|nr:hypothetical protein HanPI659440_Chr04g0140851 [Helianthus annuus]KAJ0794816.1 hypothetical protein HanPI659440_Chr04g0143391 [Helianthus annuus]